MTNATDNQLELGFNPAANVGVPSRRGMGGASLAPAGGSPKCATSWSGAMDWEAAGEPRPEQIWIPGAAREVKV